MSGLKRLGTAHQCDLIKGSNSCLPKISPQASRIKKWMREIHKHLMVSSNNSKTKFFFRSSGAIFAERKRHLRCSHTFIIHPFSKFCIKREIIVSIIWLFTFFYEPFSLTFCKSMPEDVLCYRKFAMDSIVVTVLIINILLFFITGISNSQTKEVILKPKLIAKSYLLKYFIFDFLGTIPFRIFFNFWTESVNNDEFYSLLLSSLCFFRIVRIKTALEYFKRVTELFDLNDSTYQMICLVLLSFYFIHWWTCTIYYIPLLKFKSSKTVLQTSWVTLAKIHPLDTTVSAFHRYIDSFINTFCHFFGSSHRKYTTHDSLEQLMFSILIINGLFFRSFIIAKVLVLLQSTNSSESKYEALVNQLTKYMHKKKLPSEIQNRLMLHYENRFQKHYFEEQAILETLSDHLKYEIFLYGCKTLVEKVSLFQGLPKSTVGAIIGYLKHEVYLPNDVLIKNGYSEFLYFISFGTVCHILASGKELCHYEDGDYFGLAASFINETEEMMGNIIALEITDIFKIERGDLETCMSHDEELSEHFYKAARERFALIENAYREVDEIHYKQDVVYELRSGRILEHSLRSRRRY